MRNYVKREGSGERFELRFYAEIVRVGAGVLDRPKKKDAGYSVVKIAREI